jgi:hypothetical protein
MLVFILGLGVLLGAAYFALYGRAGQTAGQDPQRALQNVRDKAKQMEADEARRVQELMKRTQE